MTKKNITQLELKNLLEYCPNAGDFTWKVIRGNVHVGKKAGCINGRGYAEYEEQ